MIPNTHFKSEIISAPTFPFSRYDLEKDLLVIDAVVAQAQPLFTKNFKYVYRVSAGESLKDVARLASHLEEIFKIWTEPLSRSSRIVACGGGSVGDFAGFVASVLKRGLVLEHCPSTWLAAIDSSHGGKTALNLHGIKNQIGTFYPARAVVLAQDLLTSQPPARAQDGLGELIKMALLSEGKMFSRLQDKSDQAPADILWDLLLPAVEAKYHVILQDPYETEGTRKILNLGHTLGHVIEALYGLSHGASVVQGLWFALEWSVHKGFLAASEWKTIQTLFTRLKLLPMTQNMGFKPMEYGVASDLLLHDKKVTEKQKIDFIFLQKIGAPIRLAVHSEEILLEAIRQGWVRGAV